MPMYDLGASCDSPGIPKRWLLSIATPDSPRTWTAIEASDWQVEHPSFGRLFSHVVLCDDVALFDQCGICEGPTLDGVTPNGLGIPAGRPDSVRSRRIGAITVPYRSTSRGIEYAFVLRDRPHVGVPPNEDAAQHSLSMIEFPRGFANFDDAAPAVTAARELSEELPVEIEGSTRAGPTRFVSWTNANSAMFCTNIAVFVCEYLTNPADDPHPDRAEINEEHAKSFGRDVVENLLFSEWPQTDFHRHGRPAERRRCQFLLAEEYAALHFPREQRRYDRGLVACGLTASALCLAQAFLQLR